MIHSVRKCRAFLSPRMRWRWAVMIPLSVAAAGLEALGAAGVFFLIKIVSDPARLAEWPFASALTSRLPWQGEKAVVEFLTAALAIFYLLKNGLLAYVAYAERKLVSESETALARRMLAGYLALPYALHLRRNSADMVRNIMDAVHRVFERVLLSALGIFTEGLIIVGIVAVLIASAPWPTLLAGGFLFLLLAALLRVTRRYVARWGLQEHRLNRETLQSVQQSLGGLKEIRVMGREGFFYRRFAAQQEALARIACLHDTFAVLPRLLMETIFVFGMLLVLLITARGGAGEDAVALLGLCAYGGFRVLPSINRILLHLNGIRFGAAAVDHLYDDMLLFERHRMDQKTSFQNAAHPFTGSLALDRVNYIYDGGDGPALEDIRFSIRRGESIGIVGPTGSGKSTLINIMLGLLTPSAGRVTVDGRDIFAELRLWQQKIGYVPQEIYLIDDSLRRNIAFGVEDESIDEERVRAAVVMAQLEEFVQSLALGLDTVVGERGVRLSGGEKQRVAIARALYRDPEVLIFDEATSALDNQTERALSRAIESLQGEKTLILIAHRLSTVRQCGRLIFLRGGRIEGEGTFGELLQSNREFREMVSRYEADKSAVGGGAPNRV
jgi:ABC-type multidrug transport system fused ATPase/permease subunit